MECKKIIIAFLHSYGSDWRDMCLRSLHPSKSAAKTSAATPSTGKSSKNPKATSFTNPGSIWNLSCDRTVIFLQVIIIRRMVCELYFGFPPKSGILTRFRIMIFALSLFHNHWRRPECWDSCTEKSMTSFAAQAEQIAQPSLGCENVLSASSGIPTDNEVYIALAKFITKMSMCTS